MNHYGLLLRGLDVESVLTDITQFNEAVTIPGDTYELFLRYRDLNIKDGDPLECSNYPALELMPNVKGLLFALVGRLMVERVGPVKLSRFRPGMEYHSKDSNDYYNFFQLVLETNEDVTYRAGDETFKPKVGDLFWLDYSLQQHISNLGNTECQVLSMGFKKPSLALLYDSDRKPIQLPKKKPVLQQVVQDGLPDFLTDWEAPTVPNA